MSRQYAAVGVTVPAARLRQIADGHPVGETELFDIAFADAAIRFRGERRHGRRARIQRRCVQSMLVAGSVVLAMTVLICIALAFFLLAAHMSPF